MTSAARRRRRGGAWGSGRSGWPRCWGAAEPPSGLLSRLRSARSAGRRPAHGRASSSWAASASSAPSPAGRPTSCTPSGSPSSPSNSGSEIAGWPVALKTGVNGVNRPERRERRHRFGRGRVERAERQRALGQRRREQRVVGGQEARPDVARTPAAARPRRCPARRSSSGPSRRSPSSSAPCPRRSARARRPCPSRRSTGRCGCENTAPNSSPQPVRLPRRIDLLDLVPERAQQLGRVGDGLRAHRVDDRVGDGRQRRGGDPQPAGRAPRRCARTARPAAAPRSRRPARSRRARRGSPRCRRRCA